MTYGFLSVLPLILMIILAIITKRITEPVIICTIIAFIITDKTNFFFAWCSALQDEAANFAYFLLLFATIGILIKLLVSSGSIESFTTWLSKYIKGRKSALIVTWILGIIIFADDYINSLGVGTSMRKLTDKYNVSREFLAYTVNSTGAVVCTLIPMSTWGAFMFTQFEKYPVTNSAMADYVHAIPYMVYCWAALLIVPFFIFKIIPVFGDMKKAEQRALAGNVFPDGYVPVNTEEEVAKNKKGSMWDFILPMLVFVILGIIWGDLPPAVIVSIIVCAVMYLPRKIISIKEFCECLVEGVKDMVSVMMLLLFVFLLATCCTNMGASEYIQSVLKPIVIPSLLPFTTFIGVSLLAIGTGSFWGSAAIALPIFLELSNTVGGNAYVIFGAAASAITLASHISFWNDAVAVTCTACEIRQSDYASTTTPLLTIPIGITLIVYLILGFIG